MPRLPRLFSCSLSPLWVLVLGCTVNATSVRAATVLEQAADEIKAGQLIDAETLLIPLMGKHAGAAALDLMCQVRLGQNRYPDAVEMAERAVKADSGRAEYYCRLGAALSARYSDVAPYDQDLLAGRIRKAYARAVALDPKSLDGLLGLCHFYRNMSPMVGGSLEKAMDCARRIIALDTGAGELEFAGIADAKKDYVDADRHYAAAKKLTPTSAALESQWARCLYLLGRKGDAQEHLAEAVKLDPKLQAVKDILDSLEKESQKK